MQSRYIVLSALLCGALIANAGEMGDENTPPTFWGSIGFSYEAHKQNGGNDWSDKANNQFSTTVVLGVKKSLNDRFSFAGELAGWSDFGFDIADNPMIPDSIEDSSIDFDLTSAEISQAYIGYGYGDMHLKAGRMALDDTLSPWLWSDRTAGVVDISYEGLLATYKISDKIGITGAWIKNGYISSHFGQISIGDDGLFMLSLLDKDFEDTVVSVSGYYIAQNGLLRFAGATEASDTWSLWGSVESVIGGFDAGIQTAYVDGELSGWNSTFALCGKISKEWDDFSAELVLSYINDGDYSLMGAGSASGSSALWSDHEFDGDTVGENQAVAILNLSQKLGAGSLNASGAYWNYDGQKYDNAYAFVLGYETELLGMESLVEYGYSRRELADGERERDQRITIEVLRRF